MSQHFVNTQLNGEKIVIRLGWDRPLSGYFMVIIKPFENIDDDGETYPDEECLYSHLKDPNLKFGISSQTEYFKKKLTEMEISIPDEIFQLITIDGKFNMGNDVHFYDMVDYSLQLSKVDSE